MKPKLTSTMLALSMLAFASLACQLVTQAIGVETNAAPIPNPGQPPTSGFHGVPTKPSGYDRPPFV